MFYTIYKITHKESDKEYIGKHQTKDLNDGYMGSGKYIKRAINKHGIQQFSKEILYVFETEDEMNAKEAELVTEEYCNRDDTYNLCPGGNGGFVFINKNYWTPEKRAQNNRKSINYDDLKRREKLRNSLMGREITWGDKISDSKKGSIPWNKGKTLSESDRKKKSDAQSGMKNSQFGTMWITNGIENKKIKKYLTIPEGWYKGRVKK